MDPAILDTQPTRPDDPRRSLVVLDGRSLTLAAVERVAAANAPVELDRAALDAVGRNRRALDDAIRAGAAIYGVTTGLGALVDTPVDGADADLQPGILRSHAAGVGPLLGRDAVRAALTVRLNCLLLARSGVRPAVLERIALLLDHGLTPAVPSIGSVGASGDLAPSAHAFLPLLGEGELRLDDGRAAPAGPVLAACGLEPLVLAPKEALALINGTHFMAGLGALACMRARRLVVSADVVAALTIEALRGASAAFAADVHALRGLAGQQASAARLRRLLEGSRLVDSAQRVQDAYSLRCAPQVHGAAAEAVGFCERLVAVDLNAVTDNPVVFDDPPAVRSSGNFHGQSLALGLDALRIGLATLAGISERRAFRLLAPTLNGDLPAFLAAEAGRQSGYMVAQITAAALLSELRVLAHPASTLSVPTSDGQEDHVSMGMTAALRALEAVRHAEAVLAIEALCACQALDWRGEGAGTGAAAAWRRVRAVVPTLAEDRVVAHEIEQVRRIIASGDLAALADYDRTAGAVNDRILRHRAQ